jgi:hypothetical protein
VRRRTALHLRSSQTPAIVTQRDWCSRARPPCRFFTHGIICALNPDGAQIGHFGVTDRVHRSAWAAGCGVLHEEGDLDAVGDIELD